jgi:hypothetical protein
MVDESAMRIVVALVYRGASVVGKSHLCVSFGINTNTDTDTDTDTITLVAVSECLDSRRENTATVGSDKAHGNTRSSLVERGEVVCYCK